MAVWSEVELFDVIHTSRLDAEYFHPYFLMVEERVRRFNPDPLADIAGYINRGVQPQYDEDGTIKALRSVNIRDGLFSEIRQEYVTERYFENNPRGRVAIHDLLISSTGVGTLGRTLLNDRTEPLFADGHITIVRNISDRDHHFLALYLQSQIGVALITRRQRGSSGQIEIYPGDIGSIPIPRLGDSLEREIGNNYVRALELVKSSDQLYKDAESLLVHELGFDKIDLSNEITYFRDLEDVERAGRLDAQYFAPRYQRTLQLMSESGESLGDVAPLAKRYFRPELTSRNFEYIEIGNLTGDGRAESETVLVSDAPSRAQWVVNENDIITSTVRPIRRLSALIGPDQESYVCSSGFAVLEPKIIAPEVLLVWLRLPIVSEILDLHTTASMYPAISVDSLLRIPITRPSDPISNRIVQNIKAARNAITSAKQLLDDGKYRIEKLILQS